MVWLFSKIKDALAVTAVFLISIVVTAYTYKAKGRAQERLNQQNKDLSYDKETNRRMNDADTGVGDPDDDLDWLRRRAGSEPKRGSR